MLLDVSGQPMCFRKNLFLEICIDASVFIINQPTKLIILFPQVAVSRKDILDATKGIKTTNPQKIFESLFTKDFKLKKNVGKAEKSWCLKGKKGYQDVNEAKNVFMELVSGSGKTKHKFVFERQKLNAIRRWYCVGTLPNHGTRT